MLFLCQVLSLFFFAGFVSQLGQTSMVAMPAIVATQHHTTKQKQRCHIYRHLDLVDFDYRISV